MFAFKLWVVLIALAQHVFAFYPFVPAYRCVDFDLCPADTSKRTAEPITKGTPDAITLKLKQRRPDAEVSQDVKLRSIVDRAARKYRHRVSPESTALGKRTNAYTVVNSTIPTLPNSAAINQDGTDFSYFAVVNFGSSGTPMYMLMDTGASSTWVMSTVCSSAACAKHNNFGPADSTTYQSTTEAFDIGYGTGEVSGMYANDSITFAGMNLNMTFGAANTTSKDFLNFPMDGIMGLARTPGSVPTFVDAVKASKSLQSNIFSVNIDRASDVLNNGEITFGATDPTKYTGGITYTPLANTGGDWILNVDDAGTNGKGVGITGRTAYIDTGTSYIFMPPADAQILHAAIPGSSLSADGSTWYVPCSTTLDVQFFFSGIGFNVQSQDWVGGPTGTLCTSNIYPLALVGATSWLLGDTFLKNVYAVFDADSNRIGLASKPVISTPTTSTKPSAVPTSSPPVSSSLGPLTSLTTQSNAQSTVSSAATGTSLVVSPTGSSTPSIIAPSGASGFNGVITTSPTAVETAVSQASAAAPVTTAPGSSAPQLTSFLLSSSAPFLAYLIFSAL